MSDKTEAFNDILRALVDLAPTKWQRDLVRGLADESDGVPHPEDLSFPRKVNANWSKTPHVDVFMLTSRDATSDMGPGEQMVPMMFDTILSNVEVERLVRYMRQEQGANPDSVRIEFAGHARVRLIYPKENAHCTVTHRLDEQLRRPSLCEQPGECTECEHRTFDRDALATFSSEKSDNGDE
jgi:hypothetical protein